MSTYFYPEERIAVVGMGGLFPDASNIEMFWSNILQKKVSIRDIPNELLNRKIFYRPDVHGKVNKDDKTYTKIAAITEVENYAALCRKYKIPPTVAEHMDPNQHAAIYCVDQALQSLPNDLPKGRTAVILGTGAAGKRHDDMVKRIFYKKVEDYLYNHLKMFSKTVEEVIESLSQEVLKETNPITEDSAPGMLQNITAARITNVFGFFGPSYTVDAACASALAATSCGIAGLLRHEYDAVITGAVEVTFDEVEPIAFSGINALSPDGSFPFDERANGFVIGLGGGVLILKRLSDALKNHDPILALISGYGQGSDGKGKYIAAPNEEGQIRVIQNACRMAGYPVDTIQYLEAHGTGTIVGDIVETSALKKAFHSLGATRTNYCGIGSVKSNIGHLRYAAGAPGLIKATLALHKKVLPPTASIQKINPKLQLEGSPFYILTDKKEWHGSKFHPRRANVSSFGFGGADYHIAMEEFRPEFLKKTYSFEKVYESTEMIDIQKKGGRQEVLYLSGDSLDELTKSIQDLIQRKEAQRNYSNFVFLNNCSVSARKNWRAAICAGSLEEMKEKWDIFCQYAKGSRLDHVKALQSKGIYFGKGAAITSDNISWVFPGQTSQYPNMLKDICDNYASIESLYLQADAIWKAKYGYSITSRMFGNEEVLRKELKNTKNNHPAIFLSNIAMYRLLTESGVQADYMLGYSLGEITALYASGMMDLKTAFAVVGARGDAFEDITKAERGMMVSIKSDKVKVEDLIKTNSFNVAIANYNSPEQTFVGGTKEEIGRLIEFLESRKIIYTILKVSHAFHTSLAAKAAESFYKKISGITYNMPRAKVMACHLVDFYPCTEEGLGQIPDILKNQMVSPVNFVDSVLKLYEKGVRIFIEAGPSSVLTNLIKTILHDKDVRVISSNNGKKDTLQVYQYALAELFSLGLDICTLPTNQILGRSESQEAGMAPAGEVVSNIGRQKDRVCSLKEQTLKESIVYSGVSFGLPGTFKKAFAEDNFELLQEGKNMIEMLTDDEMNSLLDLNITRIIKNEEHITFRRLSTINEVIQLAGKFGKIDMLKDYLVDEKIVKQMTLAVCAAVAAGYEALKDAGIPLVREQIKTSSGLSSTGRWVLPKEMQEETGIIYANGLFPIETVISEVSKYVASKYGRKTRKDLANFYEEVISKVSDLNIKKLLSDWFAMHYSKLIFNHGENEVYEFNHHFMSLLYSQANNRLAQFIGASGPNFYLNAACSSTTSAVTVAEDLIQAGHAKRMIVIGADSASTKEILPWVGAGFLGMGAVTSSSNVFEAAVPFDNRRNGMILGAGAVGLILEKEADVNKRGMNGICRVLGTHTYHTAGHQSQIGSTKYGIELDKFLSKMESEYQLSRDEIASKTVYYSHETYSLKQGGCSQIEKMALEKAFGGKYKALTVINTKGMTGHPMGASIEEAVAAKVLQYQKVPPIANYRESDPTLGGLNLSKGSSGKFEFVLRMVIGFGGQCNFYLLQRVAAGEQRIMDDKAYQEWLQNITCLKNIQLKYYGKLLVAEGDFKDSNLKIKR